MSDIPHQDAAPDWSFISTWDLEARWAWDLRVIARERCWKLSEFSALIQVLVHSCLNLSSCCGELACTLMDNSFVKTIPTEKNIDRTQSKRNLNGNRIEVKDAAWRILHGSHYCQCESGAIPNPQQSSRSKPSPPSAPSYVYSTVKKQFNEKYHKSRKWAFWPALFNASIGVKTF